ncbi:MAG: helix-hairpin-helix domain-containing protein [Alistipes sp.]|nr:helix-hairpin-helix domain-containing protein [Alistipes sp.]
MKLFTDQERRGLVVLLPLLFVVVMLAVLIERREPSVLLGTAEVEPAKEIPLQPFDPNADEYEQMRSSGVPSHIAASIVRWRSYGKVYRIREDLTQVSGMTDSIYALLKPYIIIADSLSPRRSISAPRSAKPDNPSPKSVRPREATPNEPFRIDTASATYLTRWGFSLRQAEVVIRYRDASDGIRSEEQLRRCYVVSDEMAERLLPYIIFSPAPVPDAPATQLQDSLLEINSADSAALVAINGIGAKSASEIIRYRTLLGGYHSVEQISELKVITEENFAKILQQICCDSCKISKIDINFAGPKELERHPYVSARALRRIVKQRQLKGGWTRIEEMIDDDILSEDEAERLAPYLRFRLSATE